MTNLRHRQGCDRNSPDWCMTCADAGRDFSAVMLRDVRLKNGTILRKGARIHVLMVNDRPSKYGGTIAAVDVMDGGYRHAIKADAVQRVGLN